MILYLDAEKELIDIFENQIFDSHTEKKLLTEITLIIAGVNTGHKIEELEEESPKNSDGENASTLEIKDALKILRDKKILVEKGGVYFFPDSNKIKKNKKINEGNIDRILKLFEVYVEKRDPHGKVPENTWKFGDRRGIQSFELESTGKNIEGVAIETPEKMGERTEEIVKGSERSIRIISTYGGWITKAKYLEILQKKLENNPSFEVEIVVDDLPPRGTWAYEEWIKYYLRLDELKYYSKKRNAKVSTSPIIRKAENMTIIDDSKAIFFVRKKTSKDLLCVLDVDSDYINNLLEGFKEIKSRGFKRKRVKKYLSDNWRDVLIEVGSPTGGAILGSIGGPLGAIAGGGIGGIISYLHKRNRKR